MDDPRGGSFAKTLPIVDIDADPRFTLRWRSLPDGSSHLVNWSGADRPACCEMGLEVRSTCSSEPGGVAHRTWSIEVRPNKTIEILDVKATVDAPIAQADAVFLNGYQSWTDSVERRPTARVRGLDRVPRFIVDRYVLDGSGDYRFTRYDHRRGRQHGFCYGYIRRADMVALVGSLEEESGFTVLRTSTAENELTLEKEPPSRPLAAGEFRRLMAFAICQGAREEAVARWLVLAGIRPLPAPPLVGYSSWYRRYGEIDAESLLDDLKGATRVLCDIDLGPAQRVFQIDDGYSKVGDWLEFDRSRFPLGPATVLSAAREEGFIPGIWLAPFVCERDSELYAAHPDWLLRDASWSEVRTGSNWSGAVALDTRNSEVRDYIAKVISTVTANWGAELLKLDFLFAACMIAHDGLNRGELMADALELLRESAAPRTRMILCGVPLASAFGKAEYCRIGCDVGLDWDDRFYMRLLHRERISTKNSLRNTYGRAHLDGRAFRCDPDAFFLRAGDVNLTTKQKESLLEADIVCGGVLLTSDDMGAWTADQIECYRAAVRAFAAKEDGAIREAGNESGLLNCSPSSSRS